ncbi:hypothetical protein E3N88_21631 [Mikania micrantha]|uniref:Uncharacterized protein n=1 Tax=Mikania micrantha TaxID=192012 RepID=A0A5N6N9Y5_9ASTR|nr:hypothetical protein E3N88_21631 [Mikania micrantha]
MTAKPRWVFLSTWYLSTTYDDLCLAVHRCCWISEINGDNSGRFVSLYHTDKNESPPRKTKLTDTDGDGLLAIDFTGEVGDSEMVGED